MRQPPRDNPLPPHSIENEQAVLGCVLLDGAAGGRIWPAILQILSPNSFYREQHSIIYRAMLSLNERDIPCDLLTLSDELEKRGQLEEAGNTSYLTQLALAPHSHFNGPYYARIVAEKAEARRMLQEAGRMARDALSGRTKGKSRRRVVNFREVKNGDG